MYHLQELLWDVRREPRLAELFGRDPDSVLDSYLVTGPEREELKALDFRALYERGVNPYLLYFCALQLGVDRAAYYANLRGEQT